VARAASARRCGSTWAASHSARSRRACCSSACCQCSMRRPPGVRCLARLLLSLFVSLFGHIFVSRFVSLSRSLARSRSLCRCLSLCVCLFLLLPAYLNISKPRRPRAVTPVGVHQARLCAFSRVRQTPSLSALWCILTGMRGPTCIFWANLTPFSLRRRRRRRSVAGYAREDARERHEKQPVRPALGGRAPGEPVKT
jgi:hypothetical protein